jgi:hypothetical protein
MILDMERLQNNRSKDFCGKKQLSVSAFCGERAE